MIKGSITNNIKLPKLGAFDSTLATAIRRLTIRCMAISKENYFISGGGKGSPAQPDKLTSRSGDLRRSINASYEDQGKTGIVGVKLKYGALHEYGLSVVAQRKSLKLAPHLATRKNGERVMTGSPYGIKFPERSFLRAALKDVQPFIKPEIDAAVKKAVSL